MTTTATTAPASEATLKKYRVSLDMFNFTVFLYDAGDGRGLLEYLECPTVEIEREIVNMKFARKEKKKVRRHVEAQQAIRKAWVVEAQDERHAIAVFQQKMGITDVKRYAGKKVSERFKVARVADDTPLNPPAHLPKIRKPKHGEVMVPMQAASYFPPEAPAFPTADAGRPPTPDEAAAQLLGGFPSELD